VCFRSKDMESYWNTSLQVWTDSEEIQIMILISGMRDYSNAAAYSQNSLFTYCQSLALGYPLARLVMIWCSSVLSHVCA
jgi:hypothetical protein